MLTNLLLYPQVKLMIAACSTREGIFQKPHYKLSIKMLIKNKLNISPCLKAARTFCCDCTIDNNLSAAALCAVKVPLTEGREQAEHISSVWKAMSHRIKAAELALFSLNALLATDWL